MEIGWFGFREREDRRDWIEITLYFHVKGLGFFPKPEILAEINVKV